MKKVITISHCILTVALLIVIIFTSYFSPLSEVAPVRREITEKVDQDFTYKDSYIYLRGSEEKEKRVTLGFDSLNPEFNQGIMHFIFEDGKIKTYTSMHLPDDETIAYVDEDGDGLPEKKVTKKGEHMQTFELESTKWNLTKDNQSGDDNSE